MTGEHRGRRPGRGGLSLMELMVAMAVIAFALLTMLGVYISGVRLMSRGEEITVATEVGRRLLETVRSAGYAYIPDAPTVYDGRVPDPRDPGLGFPPGPYPVDGRYELEVKSEKIEDNLKSVTVRVYYDGDSHVVLQTYFRP